MKNIFALATTALIAAVALAGCASMANIQNPEYSLSDLDVRLLGGLPPALNLDFEVEVRNPNRVGLNLDRVDFDVLINDSLVARGITQERVTIPAQGVGQVRIGTRVGYDQVRTIYDQVVRAIQGQGTRYELRGRAYYRTPLGTIDYPFTIYRRQ